MKTQTTSSARRLVRIATAALGLALPVAASADSYIKAGTGTDLTDTASWATSIVPGSADIATWDATSLGVGLTMATGLSWQGIAVTGALSDIGITGAGALTLGTSGIDLSATTRTLTIANPIVLNGDQTWKGSTLNVSGNISGTGALTIFSGQKVLTFSSFLTGSDQTMFSGAALGGKTVADLTAANGVMGGGFIASGSTSGVASSGYKVTPGASTATFQFRVADGGYTKSVGIQLTQSGADILGKVLYAKYINGTNLANDFDTSGNVGTIATSYAAPGYGAASTTATFGTGTTVTLSGNNTFTGGITVNSGILNLATTGLPFDSAAGNGGGAITVNTGGVLRLSQAFNAGYSRAITIDSSTLNINTGAAADGNNYINNLTLKNGAVVTGNAPRFGYHSNATITVDGNSASTIGTQVLLVKGGTNSATFNVLDVTTSSAVDLTISGVIADFVGLAGTPLVKSGAGTLFLSAANTYTGNVTVNGGTFKLGNKNAAGAFNTAATKVTVAAGGAVDFNGILDATFGYTIAGTGVGGTGALTNSGGGIGGGTAQATNITLSGDASIGGSGNWALLAGGHAATNLNLGGFTLTKTGANTVSLATTTTTAGTIQVSAGGLAFGVTEGGSGVTGTASALLLDNATGVSLTVRRASSIGSLSGGGVSGGNVALGANTLTVGGLNTDTTFAGVLSGTGGSLTKTGTGILTLSGTNTYTGTTTINAGTLALDASGSIDSSTAVTIASGAVFDVSAAGFTLGTGKTLTGGRTSSPATDIIGNLSSAGTLKPAADGTIGTLTTTGNLTLGGTLNLDLDAASNAGDSIAINGSLTIAAGLAVNLNNVGIQSGATKIYTVASGLTSIVDEGNLPALPANYSWDTITDPTKLLLVYTNPGAHLVWTDSNLDGVWDVGGTNNWDNGSGAAIFNDGDLVTFDDTAPSGIVHLNTSDVTPTAVTFANSTLRDYTIDGTFAIAGTTGIAKTGNGLVTLLNTNTFTGGVLLDDGTLAFAAGALGSTGSIHLSGTIRYREGNTEDISARLVMANGTNPGIDTGSNTVAFASAIGNSTDAALVKSGAGTLSLGTDSTYTGGTTINAGRIVANTNNGLGSGPVVLGATADPASLYLGNRADISNAVTVSASGSGTVVLGSLDSSGGANAATYLGTVTLNRATTLSSEIASDRLAIDGKITGNVGTLTVTGGSRTTFSATTNDFTGDILITGAGSILQASVATAAEVIPNSSNVTVDSGAILQLASNGGAETINALNGSGTVRTFPAGGYGSNLTVGSADGSGTFSGTLVNGTNALSLTKNGTGTQTLSGANTYTGATTVNAGTLAGTGAAGSNFTVKNTATLSPGVGVGIGTLNTKSLTCESGSTLKIEIDSSTATADRITAAGAVTLTGVTAAFSEIGSGTVAPGTKLVVLDYTGQSLSGTFAGLAEGASVIVGANTFTLSYVDASRVTLTAPTGGYASWKSTNAPAGTSTDDFDNDGVPNGVEYVLGGSKDTNDLDKLPKPEIVGSDMTFTFKRDHASKTLDTAVVIEVGTTMTAWPDVYPVPDAAVANNPGITVVDNSPGEATDTIILTVPMGTDPAKFARLNVTITE